jgi:hypothetical protein
MNDQKVEDYAQTRLSCYDLNRIKIAFSKSNIAVFALMAKKEGEESSNPIHTC